MKSKTSGTLFATALLLAGSEARMWSAPQWPQFRGPNCQGVAENDQPPTEFGAGTNLLWKTAVPSGVSSPCVWGDQIFLTALNDGKLVTVAVNRGDGKVRWRRPAPAEKAEEVHKTSSPASATPATDGERVYVYFASFGLLAYDFKGREVWRKPLPVPFVVNGSGTSPALFGERLVLVCDQQGGKSSLLAVEPRTGKTLWQTPRPEFPSAYTTPILWKQGEAEDIVVSGSLRVVGYGLRDGKQRWFAGGLEAVSVCPTPALGEGQMYVMSRSLGGGGTKMPTFTELLLLTDKDGDRKVSRAEAPDFLQANGVFDFIDRDRDGFITDKEWTDTGEFVKRGEYGIFALRAPGQGDVTTTHAVWKHKRGVAPVASPLFYRGRVYVVQDGGRVTCFEAKTGTKFFEQERLDAEGEYFASPVAADGRIFFCSTRGTVTVVEAADTLKVLARNELAESIMATPAIADNRLYVRTAAHLWAFGK